MTHSMRSEPRPNATDMRALGIDLGSKRIGVAVSDSRGSVATPLEVVQRQGDRQREHRELAALASEWEAEIMVVGVPYSLDGSLGPAAKKYLREATALGETLDIEVVAHDERLTTVSAERLLKDQELKDDTRRSVVDKVAAAVMLQSWLDAGMPRVR